MRAHSWTLRRYVLVEVSAGGRLNVTFMHGQNEHRYLSNELVADSVRHGVRITIRRSRLYISVSTTHTHTHIRARTVGQQYDNGSIGKR
jgi:hypothetical protein